jgi:hypothetical protein
MLQQEHLAADLQSRILLPLSGRWTEPGWISRVLGPKPIQPHPYIKVIGSNRDRKLGYIKWGFPLVIINVLGAETRGCAFVLHEKELSPEKLKLSGASAYLPQTTQPYTTSKTLTTFCKPLEVTNSKITQVLEGVSQIARKERLQNESMHQGEDLLRLKPKMKPSGVIPITGNANPAEQGSQGTNCNGTAELTEPIWKLLDLESDAIMESSCIPWQKPLLTVWNILEMDAKFINISDAIQRAYTAKWRWILLPWLSSSQRQKHLKILPNISLNACSSPA